MEWEGDRTTDGAVRRGAGVLPTSVGMVDVAWMEQELGNLFVGFQSIRINNLILSIDERHSSKNTAVKIMFVKWVENNFERSNLTFKKILFLHNSSRCPWEYSYGTYPLDDAIDKIYRITAKRD